MREHQTNPAKGRAFYRSDLQECQSRENKKNGCHRSDIIEGHSNQMQCDTLDWILEQKTDLSGKNGEIQIESAVFS